MSITDEGKEAAEMYSCGARHRNRTDEIQGAFQALSLVGLRWSITIDSRKGAGFGCKHKTMKGWTEDEAKKNGLSAELYKEYRKLIMQMKRVQRMEREESGQIQKMVCK